MIKRLIDIIFHPATLSLVFSAIIIILIPPVFNKYIAKTIKSKTITAHEVYSYHDLNKDGYSEEICYSDPANSNPTFIVKSKGDIVDQWHFDGVFERQMFFTYCDYNNDSVDEVFVFTRDNDSIFVYGINPFKIGFPHFCKKFIDKSRKAKEKYDITILVCDFPDIDKDGFKEIVFSINTGLSKQPRNLYILDIFNDSIIKSPESGTAIYDPMAFDLNGDGYNEYTGGTRAFGNFLSEAEIPYPDQHGWLMVLDKNMKFLFEPNKFGQYKTLLDINPYKPHDKTHLVVFQKHQGSEDIKNKLMLFNIDGKKIRERIVGEFEDVDKSFLISRNASIRDDIYLFYNNGQVELLDSNLQIIDSFKLNGIQNVKPDRIDIDLDGEEEFLFLGEDRQNLIITRNDFSNQITIDMVNDLKSGIYHSVIKRGLEKPQLFIQYGTETKTIEYYKNPLYTFKYLIWAGIYGVVFLFLFLFYKVQQVRIFKTERKIAELQLKSIKSQIDPHFTLNLIDSIGNLFYKKDNETAGNVFNKYAKLLRTTILSSENISISLEGEIEYVRNYLDLEQFRYDNKFQYKIETDKNVNVNVDVPKMFIHTFVENAVKHGLKHNRDRGFLEIAIRKNLNTIEIKIRDNGVGREKAREYSRLSTGKGLFILDQMLVLYFKLKKVRISYTITDLYNQDQEPEGTLITVKIPVRTKK